MRLLALMIFGFLLLAPRSAAADCTNPAKAAGEIIFNTDHAVLQYCNGTNWVAMGKPSSDPCDPVNSPAPGQSCADGSVYAGLSPDGNVPMYAMVADVVTIPWNNANTTGYVTTNLTNITTGSANTDALIALDSDSIAGGTQPHQAAQYCADLSLHGRTDWYLPARSELNVLYTNQAAIGGWANPADYYFSATESDFKKVWSQRFPDGSQTDQDKDKSKPIRCVRKGYSSLAGPGCTTPAAAAGKIIYNADHHLMQYCNGANWVAMGKPVVPPSGGSYFVMSSGNYNGNLGGLSGADATCLTDLQANDWLGKSNVTLNSSTVKAWLCASGSCQNLEPNTVYAFARAGSATAGGTTFTTTATGLGPGFTTPWSGATFFNSTADTWSGRNEGSNSQWPNTAAEESCTGWTRTSGDGMMGQTSDSGTTRWYKGNQSCSSSYRLICAVHDSGPVNGDCTSPSRTEGTMIFNADQHVMQYCNGAEWVAVTKPNPCIGVLVGGYCWYASAAGASCNDACTGKGGCNLTGTRNYAGSGGTDTNCRNVLDALGLGSGSVESDSAENTGCGINATLSWRNRRTPTTTCEASTTHIRACACGN